MVVTLPKQKNIEKIKIDSITTDNVEETIDWGKIIRVLKKVVNTQ